MIKMVVSDMDGTLLNDDETVSKVNLEYIQKLEMTGIKFIIATGRDYMSVKRILTPYNIKSDYILGNGSQYIERNHTISKENYMDNTLVISILNCIESRRIPYMIFTNEVVFSNDAKFMREFIIERENKRYNIPKNSYEKGGINENNICNHLKPLNDIRDFLSCNPKIIKIKVLSKDLNKLIELKKDLQKIEGISYASSSPDNIEITDKFAQKGLLISEIIQLQGIQKEEVMVIGDGLNDLTMFQQFPYSFAPANADELIKKLAYKIVSSSNENGFAESIYTMFKENGIVI